MTFGTSVWHLRGRALGKFCAIGLAAIVAGCATHSPVSSSRGPAELLARMKDNCGGEAWNRVVGWHETGVADLPGRPGIPHEIWHDMRTLKTAMMNRVGDRVMRHAGFNGSTYWQVKPDGDVEVGDDPAKLRRHRRDAYLSSAGWFFPERFPAEMVLAGRVEVDGTAHHVLRIAPADAEPFDLWVNSRTYRIHKIVAGAEYAELSDYRMFGGVCSATLGKQGDGNPAHELVLHVRTIDTSRAIPAATFEPPVGARRGAPGL
jgi:hypothetical protein